MALREFLERLFSGLSFKPEPVKTEAQKLPPPDPLPHFRFYPGCYEDGTLKQTDEACVTCGEAGRWMFGGSIYSTSRDKPVCAGCIADDRLASHYGAGFSMHDIDFDSDAGEYEIEVLQRTPGFPIYNPITWPVKDGVPMAYQGVGDQKHFWLDMDCRSAMQQFWRDNIGDELEGPAYHLLVFKTLDGETFGFALDLD